jgi:hypothetical protein
MTRRLPLPWLGSVICPQIPGGSITPVDSRRMRVQRAHVMKHCWLQVQIIFLRRSVGVFVRFFLGDLRRQEDLLSFLERLIADPVNLPGKMLRLG